MKRLITIALLAVSLSGCATITAAQIEKDAYTLRMMEGRTHEHCTVWARLEANKARLSRSRGGVMAFPVPVP
jgi:hypothetical protein